MQVSATARMAFASPGRQRSGPPVGVGGGCHEPGVRQGGSRWGRAAETRDPVPVWPAHVLRQRTPRRGATPPDHMKSLPGFSVLTRGGNVVKQGLIPAGSPTEQPTKRVVWGKVGDSPQRLAFRDLCCPQYFSIYI